MRRKTICALTIVTAAVLTAARVWQYLWIIDVVSGFFTTTDISVYLLYGGLALFFLLAAFASFTDKTIARAHTSFLRASLTGFSLLLAGGVNLFASAYIVAGIIDGEAIQLTEISNALLGFAASLVLLYFGFLIITGRGITHKFLPLVPVLWVTVRLLSTFRRTSTVLPISENLLTLLSLVALTVYFLYFAFAVAGFFAKAGARWMFLSAVTGVVLIIPNTLGMLIAAYADAFYSLEPVWYIERVAMLSLVPLMLCTAYHTAFTRTSSPDTPQDETPVPEDLSGEPPTA
ncbi:MAG: hypothetical protein ACERKO_05755 [Acetanaerobacterium sp.]